jgi:maleate isomerase
MEAEFPALLARHSLAAGRGATFHSSRAVLHQVDAATLRRMGVESDRCAKRAGRREG